MRRLFFDVNGLVLRVHFQNAVTAGIVDPVAEHGRTARSTCGALHHVAEARAIVNIVAEDQRTRLAADEFLADEKCFGDAVRRGLHSIADADAPLAAVTEKRFEARHFRLGRNDQNIANPRQHQRGQRIVDHRLIEDRQQLLSADDGQRPQPRAGAAGQDDPFFDSRHRRRHEGLKNRSRPIVVGRLRLRQCVQPCPARHQFVPRIRPRRFAPLRRRKSYRRRAPQRADAQRAKRPSAFVTPRACAAIRLRSEGRARSLPRP